MEQIWDKYHKEFLRQTFITPWISLHSYKWTKKVHRNILKNSFCFDNFPFKLALSYGQASKFSSAYNQFQTSLAKLWETTTIQMYICQ